MGADSDRLQAHIPRGLYTFHKVVARKAYGARIVDETGRDLLDLTSGLGVMPLGYGNAIVRRAMEEQLSQLTHMCAHVMLHRPYLELAEKLSRLVSMEDSCKVFLCNSGAEAIENAVRIARYATGRRAILAFHGAYHGRTLLASTLSGRAAPYHKGFSPPATEIYHVPYAYCYRCPWSLSHPACELRCLRALDEFFLLECPAEQVAAIVVEPIQGEGGVVLPPDEFLQGLRRICSQHASMLIVDEVQSGLGRTGYTFAFQATKIQPDLLVLGKALGGGLPLAAVVGDASFMDAPDSSGLGSTFGGNPVACAGAVELLNIMHEENLTHRAMEIERNILERTRRWLDRLPIVGEVRGRGALFGIELVKDRAKREPAIAETRRTVRRCFEEGLIVVTGGVRRNVIRLLPPLTIPWRDLDSGLDILEACLGEI